MGHDDTLMSRLRAVGPADSLGQRLVFGPQVGAGGMGHVYQATDEASGCKLAVKRIQEVRVEAALERFTAEAEILESLEHPAIVAYVGHGTTIDGDHYLAMEWLEGEDLAQRLERGPLSVTETVVLGRRIADGLAAAHRAGIVHRDLKPSNIVLVEGDVARATIVDFGIARRSSGEDLTRTGELLGTPGYMAPEQIRGHRKVDGRADLFALGCVLYHALAGRRPFDGDELMTVLARLLLEDPAPLAAARSDVPVRLDQLVQRLLAKREAERPATAGDVAAELAAIRDALDSGDNLPVATISTLPLTVQGRGRAGPSAARRTRQRRVVALASAAAVAVVVLVVAARDRATPVPIGASMRLKAPPAATPIAAIIGGATPTITMALRSVPSDAVVLADDRLIGRTPLQIAMIARPHPVVLKIRKPGHREARLTVPGDRPLSQTITLEPKPPAPRCDAGQTCPPGSTCLWPGTQCASAGSEVEPNVYTPEEVCEVEGGDFAIIDELDLFHDLAKTYLLYDARTGDKCAVTMKYFEVDVKTDLEVSIQIDGRPWSTDRGRYGYYAGAIRLSAPGQCVRFGGAAGSARRVSDLGHCD